MSNYGNWYADNSGLEQVPGVFTVSVAVTSGDLAGTLYEPLMIFSAAPADQKTLKFTFDLMGYVVPGQPITNTRIGTYASMAANGTR
jgi:hypothetical protein